MGNHLSGRLARLLIALVAFAALAAACGGGGDLAADAGEDFDVVLGDAPVFDGCGSTGDDLSYTWTIVETPDDMTDDTGKLLRDAITECSFTLESAMEAVDVGTWVIELTVSDGDATATDQLTVVVS